MCFNKFPLISHWKAQAFTFNITRMALYLCFRVLSWIKKGESRRKQTGTALKSIQIKRKWERSRTAVCFNMLFVSLRHFKWLHSYVKIFNIMLYHWIYWYPLDLENTLLHQNLAPITNTNWTFLQGQLPTFHIAASPPTGSADVAQILTDLSGCLCMIRQNDKM